MATGCVRESSDPDPTTVEPIYAVGDECGANLTKVEPAWCDYKGSAPSGAYTAKPHWEANASGQYVIGGYWRRRADWCC